MLCVAEEIGQGSLDNELAWRQFEVAIAAYCNTPPPPPTEKLTRLLERQAARTRQVLQVVSG